MSPARPQRFYLLDGLRGCAALAVVVLHYQHFFVLGDAAMVPGFTPSALPFHELLAVLYERGVVAVKLFFVLSGFLFFELYPEAIRSRAISAWQFAVLRLSRLYPLHLLTLLAVAAGQWLSQRRSGHFVVYRFNDAKHFLLQLALASHWGLQDGWSFNAPVWSVSVEVLLYALFFAAARRAWLSLPALGACMALGLPLIAATRSELGFGIFCFFAGGLAQWLYQRLRLRRFAGLPLPAAALAALGLSLLLTALSARSGARLAASLQLYGAVFPALVLLLAALQDARPELGRRLRWLGDATYSTYLLHFPLQLFLIVAAAYSGFAIDYTRPAVFLAFFALLLPLALLSHRCFELPAQSLLRRALLGHSRSAGVPSLVRSDPEAPRAWMRGDAAVMREH